MLHASEVINRRQERGLAVLRNRPGFVATRPCLLELPVNTEPASIVEESTSPSSILHKSLTPWSFHRQPSFAAVVHLSSIRLEVDSLDAIPAANRGESSW